MTQPILPTRTAMDSTALWEVEAWRGLAAWMVVYAHYWATAPGSPQFMRFAFTGVDLFFVLSGFVFAPYLFGKPLQWSAFGVRRFFRIYPAYLLALALYGGLKLWQGGALLYVGEHLTFTYLQNLQIAFYYNPAFWSLPSEVEFYLTLPLLAHWCAGRPWRVATLSVVALGARVCLGWLSDRTGPNGAFMVMHHLAGMGIEFCLGAWAWCWSTTGLHRTGARWAALVLGLAGWLAMASWFGQVGDAGVDATVARGQLAWLAAACFAAMVAASRPCGKEVAPHWRWFAVWAGRLSYGVYLFHMAALELAGRALGQASLAATCLGACLTLAMAWVGFMAWEEPMRRAGRHWAKAWSH